MTIFKNIRVLTLILPVLLVSSCNQLKLENQEAKELIIKELNLPQRHSISVGINPNTSGLDALQNAGLITYHFDMMARNTNYNIGLTLTDEGQKYYLSTDPEGRFTFKTYDTDFGEITGIAVNKEDQTATVRFTTKATNVTPVAKVLSKTAYGWGGKNYIDENLDGATNQEFVFKKFDNGWQRK